MILIGEKLNGFIPSVGAAIRARDEAAIRALAAAQQAGGAHYLDVCAAVEPAMENETLRWLLSLVQEEVCLPICLDSPDPEAILANLSDCRRPGLINSISMEKGKADKLLPAVASGEWKVIALLCGDGGIPADAEGRMAVFGQLMDKAARYGVAPERIFIDPMVTALATDEKALTVFLECCRRIQAEHTGVHITSGLSNVSTGLPGKAALREAFLVLAMGAGMDSAILDPTNEALMKALYAAEALLGRDPHCLRYIDRYKPRAQDPLAQAAPSGLEQVRSAVLGGQVKEIQAIVTAALEEGLPAEEILNGGMISAMERIGEQFSRGERFMPELMLAARAMKKGVAVLKPRLAPGAAGALGRVVIGTVAGDLHDIGKNLVAMMLESAGFTVEDLGADVSPARFQAAAAHPDVRIVGLSALLTTTMPAMKATCELLDALPNRGSFKIFIGGAPVSQKDCGPMGADEYTPDAAAAAARAKALFAGKAR